MFIFAQKSILISANDVKPLVINALECCLGSRTKNLHRPQYSGWWQGGDFQQEEGCPLHGEKHKWLSNKCKHPGFDTRVERFHSEKEISSYNSKKKSKKIRICIWWGLFPFLLDLRCIWLYEGDICGCIQSLQTGHAVSRGVLHPGQRGGQDHLCVERCSKTFLW